MCFLSYDYNNIVNKVNDKKIENKNYRDKQRKMKDNFDKIFDYINQEYWINIEKYRSWIWLEKNFERST